MGKEKWATGICSLSEREERYEAFSIIRPDECGGHPVGRGPYILGVP